MVSEPFILILTNEDSKSSAVAAAAIKKKAEYKWFVSGLQNF